MVFKALTSLVSDNNRASNNRTSSRYPVIPGQATGGRRGGSMLIDPSQAIKANSGDLFSRNALEFINGGNGGASAYSEQQLLNAYLSSVYLFAALRRVSNLISRVKVVGEVMEGGNWVRLPADHRLNLLFSRDGAETLSRIWLNHAVYGSSAIYKLKSVRATLEQDNGTPIYDFKDGAVAGLYVLDKPQWDIDENTTYGQIDGIYVNQYDSGDNVFGNRNYLDREEFVFVTDWNPHDPNRGMPLAAVCIHEAVANASIAQWISEYFTRGAMPFIMVSMAEDDPALMTDSDLRKYKKQFEEYWVGIGSSLRSVFFDRAINVEQVGIPADEVAAPDLNSTALEGIAATIGLDRELIVTPEGGSQERHALLIKRAWEDTVIPLAEKYISAFNRDLGLPENMRLVADVSGIAELEADRENKADTEISIYESQLQSYNEARTRLQMPPIEKFDDFFFMDGRAVPIDKIIEASQVPHEQVVDYAMQLWDGNLARRSEILALLGRDIPENMMDGFKYEIEDRTDLVTSMWGDDLLRRSDVLSYLGFNQGELDDNEDGYRSELERGADYGEWVTQLWDDNLLTRSQVLQALDMGLELPEGAPDGYADEIGDRKSNVMDMWGDNLLTRQQTLERLGVELPHNMIDGYVDEIEIKLDRAREAENDYVERIMDYWGDDLITRSSVMDMLRLPKPDNMIDGFQSEVDAQTDAIYEQKNDDRDFYTELWGDNLITRSDISRILDIPMPDGAVDGYVDEVEAISEALTDNQIAEMNAEEEVKSTGNIYKKPEPDPEPPTPTPTPPAGDFIIEELDDASYWRDLVDETVDPLESVISEIEYEDDAYGATEEDWLEDNEDTEGVVLEPNYGGMVDLLPAEALPHADDDIDEYDGMPPYDPYLDDSEVNLYDDDREDDEYGIGDYYTGYAAPNSNPLPPVSADDEFDETAWDENYLEDEAFIEVYDDILNPPVVPMDDIWDEIVDDIEGDFDDAVEVIEDPSESTVGTKDLPRDLYVSLWVGYDERLEALAEQIKEQLGDVEVDWQDPDTYHVTLVYSPDATDQDTDNVMSILPDGVGQLLLHADGISTFDNDDATVIKVGIGRSDALEQLQAKIATAFNAYGIKLSPYSDPADYKPHITLGYAPPNTEIPEIEVDMPIKPQTIYMGRDGYDMVDELPIDDVMEMLAYDESQSDELDEYEITQPLTQDEMVATVTEWYKSHTELMDSVKRDAPAPDTTVDLPENILSYMIEFIVGDSVTDRVIHATIQAIRNGEFDEGVVNAVNPIKQAMDNLKAVQNDAHEELNAWQRATMKRGLKKALKFETHHLTQEMTESVKSELSELGDIDREQVDYIFDKARQELNNQSQ